MEAPGTISPPAIRWMRIAGYFVFLAAFFLPAVRQAGSSESFKGYFCAWITLINTLNRGMWRSKDFLAILSGWINPLMLIYVASLFSRKLAGLRRVIAVVVLLFILGTWIYFYLQPLIPLIGHALWIAGILMILANELTRRREVSPQ
jgi:hypothetical protein